ncbi:carnitine O-acetyltransferase [Malassezia cuniculi]|uniref:Carnitine O-acetyltransferase, mitochondrial n=1 Tax=Malassezia cuniculi TaxID=948313 RepID=A0AAF0J7C5_9BASI|nr:carnitine O-acetyltransferase [Malassezia cuniculi]
MAPNAKPLYSAQASLPQLPVPDLEQTLSNYLRTTLPLQESKQTLAVTENAVKDAVGGKDKKLMNQLQERLIHRATAEGRESWLYDWWKTIGYTSYRDPLVPFVSYYYIHRPDPSVTKGTERAAQILKAVLAFRELVVSERLEPEKTKAGPMCMEGFKWMFNVSRIPVKPEDQPIVYDPAKNNHVIVMRNGHFFEIEVIHPETGKELSAAEIQSQLEQIVADPEAQVPIATPIGALTSDNRDAWTESREVLLNVPGKGEHNAKILDRIDSSIIVINLDNASPITVEERAWSVWTGNGSNRYYDKQQFIIADNGTSGFVGEHSMMDGTHTLRLNNFVLQSLQSKKLDLTAGSGAASVPAPKRLEFAVDANVQKSVTESLSRFNKLMGAHNLSILDFHGYGKGAIKKFRCSPDAWVQMMIQMAYHKLHGETCATYEAAQTRKFKLGRTETIRSASVESAEFVKSMEDPSASDEDRYAKFQAAVKQHLSYASAAADGQAIDRHFFGLKNLLREGEERPAIFTDPMFAKSSTWLLSTSQISTEVFDAWGFGEVTPKGYGVAYAIKEDSLTISACCLRDEHSPQQFTHYLNRAAIELRDLHLRLAAKQQGGSKL